MNRERQIELLANAKERAESRVATWLATPMVKDALRRNHEATRDMKKPQTPLRACR